MTGSISWPIPYPHPYSAIIPVKNAIEPDFCTR